MGIRAGIIIASDRSAQGLREDASGPALQHMLSEALIETVKTVIVADEKEEIKLTIKRLADEDRLDLILTSGGTGVSPRDVTPDATLEVIEKQVPGIAEAMRYHSFTITPHAMISRAVAGIRGTSLIINLPGSPKGATENLSIIMPALKHAIEKIKGDPSECASSF